MSDRDNPQRAETVLLSIDQVAERCRVSKRTVETWISAGDIASVKLGGRRRVREIDLAGFIERHLEVTA